ncbi:hypothetical protein [Streptomyces sp. NPDC093109]|uniref:hypothetical protein n=1 Tax=Streptomyces sp. NPDC093109 TaxID=3154977 RepID=UPI00344D0126
MMPGIVAERRTSQVTDGVLVERRRAGELFPRVPVGPVELTREQAAAGLFTQLDTLPSLPERPTDLDLLRALDRALGTLGVTGLDRVQRELEALPLFTPGAGTAWAFAYRLCVEYWYEGALCEPLGQGEMTVALYTSDIVVSRRRRGWADHVVDGHLMEGVARIGSNGLVTFADEVGWEFGKFAGPRVAALDLSAEYRTVMPDARRRKFCYDIAVDRCFKPRPLMACFNDGGFAVGAVPPESPHLLEMFRDIRAGRASAERETVA